MLKTAPRTLPARIETSMPHENTCRTGVCPVRVASYSIAVVGLAALGAIALVLGVAGARAGGNGSVGGSGEPDGSTPPTPPAANATPSVAVVELFTSEGCSSCPPADAVLADLAKTDPARDGSLILLAWHVDYWDNLGWKAPFASAYASERQRQYNDALELRAASGRPGVYTPQAIVNGSFAFVGSDGVTARRRIAQARSNPLPTPALASLALRVGSRQPGQPVTARVEPPADLAIADGSTWVFALVEDHAQSDVKHGENSGRVLHHARVVRAQAQHTARAGQPAEVTLQPPADFAEPDARVVVLLQAPSMGPVLTATSAPLAAVPTHP